MSRQCAGRAHQCEIIADGRVKPNSKKAGENECDVTGRSEISTPGESSSIFCGPPQSLGFADGFLILGLRVAVVDDAATGLNIQFLVLQHGGPQGNAEVHLAVAGEIAYAAPVDAALSGSSSSMISIARTWGAPVTVPAGIPASRAERASWPSAISPTTLETMCMTWL